ncbi:adenylosuccinate lyase [Streptomyces sp. SID2999]|uniref:lyase family protein n=1 Tax=Streptomyces sp. SID2999 TaxID=2690258 RepID=UPI00136E102D|nr:lyase family protein [Streptomyces sp. SID2999]MYZ08980.1 adenylosuccinate lyase [Streptomyces sp. SID2999]
MIARYVTPEMAALLGDGHRYDTWRRVEEAVCAAYVDLGLMPAKVLADVRASDSPTVEAVRFEEVRRDHEILGFLEAWAPLIPDGSAAMVHRGLTSYDLVDTANAIILKEAGELLLAGCEELLAVFRDRITRHWATPCLGRTHGMAAQATTFGHRLATVALELNRAVEVLRRAVEAVAVGTVSGAVGTYVELPLALESSVLDALGVGREPLASQVVGRDRHAQLASALALVSAVVEHLALDLRLLSQTGVEEVEEPRPPLYQGSSIMPHKHNPTGSERLCGLARLVRGNATAVLETVALWNERDLSNSCVERVALADALSVTEYQVTFAAGLLRGLVVREDVMLANLRQAAVRLGSPRAMTDLIDAGASREEAYRRVQAAVDSDDPAELAAVGLTGRDTLDEAELRRVLPHRDELYERVMKELG